ncbi:MAG TPA: Calx-beta domain-containing protein [Candidatus Saccharimonadales bacterium]|nr:Calx-beta domain-containing protein [Candidatus Saccharimonadales bacterium]
MFAAPANAPAAGPVVPLLTQPDQAPAWAVRYGAEFWRREPADASATAPPPANGAVQHVPFSIADVMDRVHHALEADPQQGDGLPSVIGASYAAKFDGEGLRFSPHRPISSEPAEPDGNTAAVAARPLVTDADTEARVRTTSVQKDGEVFYAAGREPVEWTALGNTAQGLLSRDWGIVTHFEASAEGVEAAWVFSNPLPGAGLIEVAFNVEGLNYAGETESGHHFADASGTARVRVGQAFAVDAAGTRWELATTAPADGSGRLVVRLPAEIQAEAQYPLAIDPVVGAEFGMDLPVSNPSSGGQGNASVAANGTGFLVVWEDSRGSGATSTDIYGARVSNGGVVLDPLGIAICTASGAQVTPSVAWNSFTYLVTWLDTRMGGSDIFGARVSSSGVVQDPLGFGIAVDGNNKATPSVAGSPTGFLVAWDDDRNSAVSGTDIFGARVSSTGLVLDPLGFGICTNNGDQNAASLTADGGGFFAAWSDNRNAGVTGTDVYGARISSGGIVLEPAGVALCNVTNTQLQVAAAANGTNILVVWRDRRNQLTTGYDIFGTRVSTAGNIVTVLDPLGIAISVTNGVQQTPSVGRCGDGFLVAWRDGRNGGGDDVYAARVSPLGSVLEPSGLVINTNTGTQFAPSVSGNSAGTFVAFTDPRNAPSPFIGNNIYGARVSSAGVLLETNHIAVSLSGGVQAVPAVAFNGTNYLVVWQDERAFTTNNSDIRGARVSQAGKVLDIAGIGICTLPSAQQRPAVGVSGGDFLVAWEDGRNSGVTGTDIYGSRVTSAGAVSDPAGLVISAANGNQAVPSVAGNATTFLVAWQDPRAGGGSVPDIYCTRVSPSGVVANPTGVAISTIGANEFNPKVASTTNGFLVAWEDDNADILGARVSNAGTVLDPSGASINVCTAGSCQTPSVAAVGTNFLVAWVDTRSAGDTGDDIYATRVSGNGTVQDVGGFPVWTGVGDQDGVVVAGTGTEYVLVWEDSRAGQELVSARVGTDGVVLDPQGVPLAGSGDRVLPAATGGAGGKLLVVSEGFRKNSQRIVASVMTGDTATANPIIQFSSSVFSISEAGKWAKVKVGLKGKYSGVITVDLITVDGTAVAGADYMPQATRLVFSAGKTSVQVSIPIINDTVVEGNETVTLNLRNVVGGAYLGPKHTATLTIVDDD